MHVVHVYVVRRVIMIRPLYAFNSVKSNSKEVTVFVLNCMSFITPLGEKKRKKVVNLFFFYFLSFRQPTNACKYLEKPEQTKS